MKTIVNAKDAGCRTCFFSPGAELVDGVVVCKGCGSRDLIDVKKGGVFEPVFGVDPEKTFRASKYTPPLPDRRKARRAWPVSRERRQGMFV